MHVGYALYQRRCGQEGGGRSVLMLPITSQAFPQWEQAKANLRGSPQLHIFTLANVVQRPIIVYAHQECTVGYVKKQSPAHVDMNPAHFLIPPTQWCLSSPPVGELPWTLSLSHPPPP